MSSTQSPNGTVRPRGVNATRLGVSVVGVIGGLISMEHGLLETLQGNTPAGGMLICAIGPANRFWEGGSERALTIIPNYLISGICAMLVLELYRPPVMESDSGTQMVFIVSPEDTAQFSGQVGFAYYGTKDRSGACGQLVVTEGIGGR